MLDGGGEFAGHADETGKLQELGAQGGRDLAVLENHHAVGAGQLADAAGGNDAGDTRNGRRTGVAEILVYQAFGAIGLAEQWQGGAAARMLGEVVGQALFRTVKRMRQPGTRTGKQPGERGYRHGT